MRARLAGKNLGRKEVTAAGIEPVACPWPVTWALQHTNACNIENVPRGAAPLP